MFGGVVWLLFVLMGWGTVVEPIGLLRATCGIESVWVDGGKGAGEEEVSKQKGAGEQKRVGVGVVVVWFPTWFAK